MRDGSGVWRCTRRVRLRFFAFSLLVRVRSFVFSGMFTMKAARRRPCRIHSLSGMCRPSSERTCAPLLQAFFGAPERRLPAAWIGRTMFFRALKFAVARSSVVDCRMRVSSFVRVGHEVTAVAVPWLAEVSRMRADIRTYTNMQGGGSRYVYDTNGNVLFRRSCTRVAYLPLFDLVFGGGGGCAHAGQCPWEIPLLLVLLSSWGFVGGVAVGRHRPPFFVPKFSMLYCL